MVFQYSKSLWLKNFEESAYIIFSTCRFSCILYLRFILLKICLSKRKKIFPVIEIGILDKFLKIRCTSRWRKTFFLSFSIAFIVISPINPCKCMLVQFKLFQITDFARKTSHCNSYFCNSE